MFIGKLLSGDKQWKVKILLNGKKNTFLGRYATEEEANQAYRAAANKRSKKRHQRLSSRYKGELLTQLDSIEH